MKMKQENTYNQFISENWIRKIENCINLEELFDIWEEEAVKRGEKFLRDGSLSDAPLESHEILFVCRESNDTECKDSHNFWMKRVVQMKSAGKDFPGTTVKENRAATKYYNCMHELINSPMKVGNEDKTTEILKRSAYININKSGGGNKADFQKLAEYALTYEPFIRKQIKIINPKKIIILGKLYGEPLIEFFEKIGQETQIEILQYNRHPCVWSKNELKNFTCNIQKGASVLQ